LIKMNPPLLTKQCTEIQYSFVAFSPRGSPVLCVTSNFVAVKMPPEKGLNVVNLYVTCIRLYVLQTKCMITAGVTK